MIKKTLITLTLLTTLVSPAFAQGKRPDTVGLPGKTEPERDAALESRVEEVSARIVSKIDQRINKYEEFFAKLDLRRNALLESGADVTEVDRLMRVAKANLTALKAEVQAFASMVAALDFSQGPKTVFASIRTEIAELRTSFNTLHQSVVEVVQEIGRLSESN